MATNENTAAKTGVDPPDNLGAVVVDTPLINKQAIVFYERNGFAPVEDMPKEFSKYYTFCPSPPTVVA